MSSCLSGGGRAIRLDLEIIKSPSSSWISNSSSSTLTESSNSPVAISTRKPRTPRKRPNQTYNEAAAILSAAYPKIFSIKYPTKPYKFTKPHNNPFPYESSDLFMPFRVVENSGFLLHPPILENPNIPIVPKEVGAFDKPCQSPGEINSGEGSSEICDDYQEDFDAGSILDAEVEEGIDSIMGKLSTGNSSVDDSSDSNTRQMSSWCYGYPIGLGFGGAFGFGMRRQVRAMKKNVDDENWWRFPSVNVQDITPKTGKILSEKKKKKVEKAVEPKSSTLVKLKSSSIKPNKVNSASKSPKKEAILPVPNAGLSLKLNYDDVLNAWSDKDSPFSGETPPITEAAGHDVQTRLAQIDLFGEDEARDASVLRDNYKERRRTRHFSKKIRYQVRKINVDQRPKMKGRLFRSPDSPENEQES